jgi:hypothetical protein
MANDTNNVTQMQNLQNKTFNFDQVKGLVGAITHAGVTIEQAGNGWKILAEDKTTTIPGLDVNRTYATFNEAVLFLMGALLQGDAYKGIVSGVAA